MALTSKMTIFFVSFNKGSERSSKDLNASNDLDDNLDQEWSQISQMHNRYFHSVLSAQIFVLAFIFYLKRVVFFLYVCSANALHDCILQYSIFQRQVYQQMAEDDSSDNRCCCN